MPSSCVIYSDTMLTLWSYGFSECSKTPNPKIRYTRIKSVCRLNNSITFTYDNYACTCHKTKHIYGTGKVNNATMISYDNKIYEVFYMSSGKIRIDVYDTLTDKYLTIDVYNYDCSMAETIIQKRINGPIDHSKIVYATVVYDHHWPNYTIVRSAYCDVIIETAE